MQGEYGVFSFALFSTVKPDAQIIGTIQMTRITTLILFLISTGIFAQTELGGLKILVQEKTKNAGPITVANHPVTITLNDTISYTLTTDQEGSVLIRKLAPGKYTVKIKRDDCQSHQFTGIVVGAGKTAYISAQLSCKAYINSLTKKEKKRLGYR